MPRPPVRATERATSTNSASMRSVTRGRGPVRANVEPARSAYRDPVRERRTHRWRRATTLRARARPRERGRTDATQRMRPPRALPPTPVAGHRAAVVRLSCLPRAPRSSPLASDATPRCRIRQYVLPNEEKVTAGRPREDRRSPSDDYAIVGITYLATWSFDRSVIDVFPEASCEASSPIWLRGPLLPGLFLRSGAQSFDGSS